MSGIVKPPFGAQLNLDHPLAQGLVGCWLMNEGSGIYTHDYSGQGNIGTLSGFNDPPIATSGWNAGPHGGALAFDGSNDYVNCGTSILKNYPVGTVAMWIYPTALTNTFRYPIASNASAGGSLAFRISTDGSCWWTVDNAVIAGSLPSGTFLINTLYFITISWNGVKWVFYKNAINIEEVFRALGTSSAGNTVWIGDGWDGLPFAGLISSVFIYNRALSAEEIAHLYAFPYCMFDYQEYPAWLKRLALYPRKSFTTKDRVVDLTSKDRVVSMSSKSRDLNF